MYGHGFIYKSIKNNANNLFLYLVIWMRFYFVFILRLLALLFKEAVKEGETPPTHFILLIFLFLIYLLLRLIKF